MGWAVGSLHSSLNCLNCWWKVVQRLIWWSWIFNEQLRVHLKWILKFKLQLYLLNHIGCVNKICGIYCAYSHIQILKVWFKLVIPWLKYIIFFYGIVCIGAPCIWLYHFLAVNWTAYSRSSSKGSQGPRPPVRGGQSAPTTFLKRSFCWVYKLGIWMEKLVIIDRVAGAIRLV